MKLNLTSEIYSDLKQRAWDKGTGRLITIAIVSFCLGFAVSLMVYNHFYPVALIHANHHTMFLADYKL